MKAAHHTALLVLVLLGALWGLCLVVGGLHAIALAAGSSGVDVVMWSIGVAGIAAGNFVFMEVVADRFLVHARPRLTDVLEVASAMVMALALLAAAAAWIAGTLP